MIEEMQNLIDEDNTDFDVINDWNEEEKLIKIQDIEVVQYIEKLQSKLDKIENYADIQRNIIKQQPSNDKTIDDYFLKILDTIQFIIKGDDNN